MVALQSESDFFENWLQFAAVHRARVSFMLGELNTASRSPLEKGSLALALLREAGQAMEDLGRWSIAIRDHADTGDALPICLDRSNLVWIEFFRELGRADADELARLFSLPRPSTKPPEYGQFLDHVAHDAALVGRYALATDPSGTILMNRWLNKEKHGLLFSLGTSEAGLDALLMHPLGATGTPHLQELSAEFHRTTQRWTLRVCLLLGVLGAQWYAFTYGRSPAVGWGALLGDVDLLAIDAAKVGAILGSGMLTSWVWAPTNANETT